MGAVVAVGISLLLSAWSDESTPGGNLTLWAALVVLGVTAVMVLDRRRSMDPVYVTLGALGGLLLMFTLHNALGEKAGQDDDIGWILVFGMTLKGVSIAPPLFDITINLVALPARKSRAGASAK